MSVPGGYASALVVDDLPGARAWLAAALQAAFPGIEVATAGTLGEALARIDPPPALALVDLGLPDGSDSLAGMLRGIAAGQPPLSPSIARRLLRHFQPLPAADADAPPLTPRETEVLRLTAKGLTLNEVATALGLSRHTVSGYLKDIYRKLSVGTRAEAALEAARRGLVAP